MHLQELLETLANLVWGPPMLALTVGTGLYLTVRLRGLQFRRLWSSLYLALVTRRESGARGDVTHFQALMTALSATVGTGNIAGVATAIVSGGPGALFWMWVTGLVGMATKFAEALLGVQYRILGPRGEMSGGPMHYLSRGFNQPLLAALYAFLAAFTLTVGGNMTQAHSIADAMQAGLGVPTLWTGAVTAAATAVVILGGIRNIARAASALVPTMIVIYSEKALEYLFGHGRFVPWYRLIWVCLTFLGPMLSLETLWTFLDVAIGSMVLPNLIGLLGLSGIVAAETRGYFAARRQTSRGKR